MAVIAVLGGLCALVCRRPRICRRHGSSTEVRRLSAELATLSDTSGVSAEPAQLSRSWRRSTLR